MMKLIAFEGIDGSGKTVQFEKLADFIKKTGKKTCKLSYPVYNSFFGKEIGKYLSGDYQYNASSVDPLSMSLWYALDRWNDWRAKTSSIIDSDYVLCNRYTLSSIVYQSLREDVSSEKQKEIRDWIEELEHNIFSLPRPMAYIVLDTSVESSTLNIYEKNPREYMNNIRDVYEKNITLQKKAGNLYRDLANEMANGIVVNCNDFSGLRSIDDIHDEIINRLASLNVI